MILVGQYDSPFVRRVAIALHHYGVPFERRVLSVFSEFEEVLKIHPAGKVPALILPDGAALFDSRAILEYLDGTVAMASRLIPEGDPERRDALQLEAAGQVLAEKIYERGIERTRRAPGTSDPNWCARLERQILSLTEWLEDRCGDGWLVGDRFSRADLAVAVAMQYAARVVPWLSPVEAHPRLDGHRKRCEALDSFRSAQDDPDEARRSGWRPPPEA